MELRYKVLCIIAIIIGIVFCYYIYKINNTDIKAIEDKRIKKIGQRLIPLPKYDLRFDKKILIHILIYLLVINMLVK